MHNNEEHNNFLIKLITFIWSIFYVYLSYIGSIFIEYKELFTILSFLLLLEILAYIIAYHNCLKLNLENKPTNGLCMSFPSFLKYFSIKIVILLFIITFSKILSLSFKEIEYFSYFNKFLILLFSLTILSRIIGYFNIIAGMKFINTAYDGIDLFSIGLSKIINLFLSNSKKIKEIKDNIEGNNTGTNTDTESPQQDNENQNNKNK